MYRCTSVAGDKPATEYYPLACARIRVARGSRSLVYGKILSRFPCNCSAGGKGGPGRTVRRLQGYPVSRASEPCELPYGVHPMLRTSKDCQGLPVVNGRGSLSTGSTRLRALERNRICSMRRAFNCPEGHWNTHRVHSNEKVI